MKINQSKKWIFLFVSIIIFLLVILEVLSYQIKDRFRHEVDYKVHLSEYSTQKNIDTILLSDSVSYGPLSQYKLKENILDLSSNQAISLAGNYFILERYLKAHKAPKKVYLFFIYDLFANNLKSKYTYLYFTTVFTKDNEQEILSSIGRSDIYDKLNYFNNRKSNIKKYFKVFKPRSKKYFTDIYDLSKTQKKIKLEAFQRRIKHHTNAKLTPFANHFLENIIKLCQEHSIKLTLVVEPMPQEQHIKFLESALYQHLKQKSNDNFFTLQDSNNYYTFEIEYFRDTIHLLGDFQKKYLDLIDQNIVKLFTYNSEQRISDLTQINAALEAYHKEHGAYPKSKGFDGLYTTWGEASKEWIKDLVPKYINALPRDPRLNTNPKEQYLYRSNGKDFKLISHGAEDCKIVKSKQPELIDPKRDCWSYGYWTEGAKNW